MSPLGATAAEPGKLEIRPIVDVEVKVHGMGLLSLALLKGQDGSVLSWLSEDVSALVRPSCSTNSTD